MFKSLLFLLSVERPVRRLIPPVLPAAAFPALMLNRQTVWTDLSPSILSSPWLDPDPCLLPRHSLETCQMFTKVLNVYLRWQRDGGTCMD